MYNTISGLMKRGFKNWEVQKIKKQIDLKYYYRGAIIVYINLI